MGHMEYNEAVSDKFGEYCTDSLRTFAGLSSDMIAIAEAFACCQGSAITHCTACQLSVAISAQLSVVISAQVSVAISCRHMFAREY